MTSEFMELTSTRGTPLFIRKSVVLFIEGFTMHANVHDSVADGQVGTRLTLLAGQYSESVVCVEQVDDVYNRLTRSI